MRLLGSTGLGRESDEKRVDDELSRVSFRPLDVGFSFRFEFSI